MRRTGPPTEKKNYISAQYLFNAEGHYFTISDIRVLNQVIPSHNITVGSTFEFDGNKYMIDEIKELETFDNYTIEDEDPGNPNEWVLRITIEVSTI